MEHNKNQTDEQINCLFWFDIIETRFSLTSTHCKPILFNNSQLYLFEKYLLLSKSLSHSLFFHGKRAKSYKYF